MFAYDMDVLKVKQVTTVIDGSTGLNKVLDNVSLSLVKGETLAVVGESGSGKSITALTIMRLLPETAKIEFGDAILSGKDLLHLPEAAMRKVRGKKIGMIFQEPGTSLNPVLTVGQQIIEVLERHTEHRGEQARQVAIEWLQKVEIRDAARRIDEYPFQFSGGMKQRVMIALALCAEPELLIADEPTTALDVTIQAQILALLKKLQRELRMSILLITHDLGVVAEMAHSVALMYGGKVLELARKDDFFSAPKHPYARELFAALPQKVGRAVSEEDPGGLPLLEVRDVQVYFPIKQGLLKRTVGHVKAVDGVSFEVPKGRTLALVGESGSGKTTVGKAILQLYRATAGSVRFAGEEMTTLKGEKLRRRRRDIQVIFQDPFASLNPKMRVGQIIEEGMLALGVGRTAAEREEKIKRLLSEVGLKEDSYERFPHEFSGGQRQRVAIARALAVDPKLIVCDEPTSALDVLVQAQILQLLLDLQRRFGISYLFITHNISVVEFLAHRIAVMYQGKLVEVGDARDVLDNPQHEYTRVLLSAVPKLDLSLMAGISG
jgi:peptide/nickel transport system ATP-binding protein